MQDAVAYASHAPPADENANDFALLDRYWRAANYLSVGQIYLFGNPLLREPLRREHIKPRLLGHWGTTPGRREGIAPSRGSLTCLFAARRVRVADGHKHRMLDNRMQCMNLHPDDVLTVICSSQIGSASRHSERSRLPDRTPQGKPGTRTRCR
jgi:hypothetical protein